MLTSETISMLATVILIPTSTGGPRKEKATDRRVTAHICILIQASYFRWIVGADCFFFFFMCAFNVQCASTRSTDNVYVIIMDKI